MDEPELVHLDHGPSHDDALIIVKGYLSQDDEPSDETIRLLRATGWTGSIYFLWWDASNEKGLAGRATRTALLGGAVAGPMGAGLMGLIGARSHFSKVKARAKKTGEEHVAGLVRGLSEARISFYGFSLGARVIYYAAHEGPPAGKEYVDVLLCGGAVRRDSSKDWGRVADSLRGRLVNVYNEDDDVLSNGFRTAEGGQSACGNKPIKKSHRRIVNVDATGLFTSHFRYKDHLRKLVEPYLWHQVNERQ